MDLKNKIVTVVGLGNSGVNAAGLLLKIGARVRVTDSRDTPEVKEAAARLNALGATIETGGHSKDFIKGSDLVVLSPGVEDSSVPVKSALGFGIPMIGEMELGFNYCRGRIIAITGTNGKSTVTSLIGAMLKRGGKDVVVCGNIGNSLSGEIGRISPDTWVVLEVSSFQLERIENFRPHIAIILNITDDHMDRYSKFSDYFNEKLKVFKNQGPGDFLILNHDAENLRPLENMAKSKVLFYSRSAKTAFPVSDMRLKGEHNVENALASCLAATLAGASEDAVKDALSEFKGLSHRFETVGVIDGVEYIDDSKGTTVDSTRRALQSCAKPVILIAGGKDKHSDYSAMRDAFRGKVDKLILIGEAAGSIKAALGDAAETFMAKDMKGAVRMARDMAKKGMAVLLSPMCSSFDMFRDYKERGEAFKREVMALCEGSAVPSSR